MEQALNDKRLFYLTLPWCGHALYGKDQHECNGLCDKDDLVLETSIIELSLPHSNCI